MVQAKSGDAEISFSVQGSGPDVVLLHPFPANHEFWKPVAEALGQRYRVVLIDLRGQGASTFGEGPATMQKQAADVLAVCRDLKITRAVFCGASIGGYILFEIWRSYREQVRGLIFCNTRAAADSEEARANRLRVSDEVLQKGPDGFYESLIPKLLGETTRRNRPDIVAIVRGMMRHSPLALSSVQLGMAQRPDSVPTLQTITVPTLFIAGDEDALVSVKEAQHMSAQVPNGKFQAVSQAGHFAPLEKPAECIRIMRQFLDGSSE